MGQIVALAFTSALNPTLIAVTTLMLLLPNPKRLMLGYLCGAALTSITLGLVILYALNHSGAVSTTQHTVSPGADLGLAALALVLAFVLGTGRDQRISDWRKDRHAKADKGPPRWQRELSKGTARTTFLVGAVLTLPGASYLAGLTALHKLGYGKPVNVLVVVGFNVVMLLLLEVPLVGFALAPERTPILIEDAKAKVSRHWHRFVFRGLILVGAALAIKGLIGLLAG